MLAHSQTIQNLADHLRSKSHEADLASANAPLTIFAYAGIALPSHAYCFFFYACFRSLHFFIFMKLHSASDVFSFCLISIFGFQGTTHRSNQLKIKPACIFIFICICIACLHAVSKSQICECGVLATLLGLSGLEPPTSRLSGVRSNRLSYKPRLSKQVHI